MSTPHSSNGGPSTEEAFQRRLVSLIRAAHANGVDVEGGWMDRTRADDRPDWGIEIYRVAKPARALDVG